MESMDRVSCATRYWLRGEMVEAAGVEPASENAVSKETTYLVAFPRRELPRHSRPSRSERTRNAIGQPEDLASNSQT